MGNVPFFGSGTGDPRRMQRRLAMQSAQGVPALLASGHDFRSNGGPIAPDIQVVPRGVFRNSPQAEPPLPGAVKIANAALAMGDFDPANPAMAAFIANFLQRYTATNSGAAYRYVMSQSQSTLFPQWMTLWSDNDTGLVSRFSDVLVQQIKIDAKSGANLTLEPTVAVGRFDLHDEGVITGTGTTIPLLRDTVLAGSLEDDATDKDIYVKVTTAPAAGVTGIKVKVAAASSYTSDEILVADATWTYLYGTVGATANAVLGTRGEQVQIYIPASPTLSVNDIIHYAKRRGRWSASFGTARPLPEINLRFFLNGYQVQAEGGWTVTLAAAKAERIQAPGGRQNVRTQRFGAQSVEITASREAVDLTFQRPLMRQDILSLVIESQSDDLIASTGVPYGITQIYPFLLDSGPVWDTPVGGASRTESHKFMAAQSPTGFSYKGVTWYDDATFIFDTDLLMLG